MRTRAHRRGLTIVASALGTAAACEGSTLLVALGLGTALWARTTEQRAPAG